MARVADLFRQSFPDAAPAWVLAGVDVSGNQAPNVISDLAGAGVEFDFAVIKTSEGSTYESSESFMQVQEARALGKAVGAYHWVSYRTSPILEFDNVARMLEALNVHQPNGVLNTAVWLDAEDTGYDHHNVSGFGYDDYTAALAEMIRIRFGCPVGVYSAAWWANGRLGQGCGQLPLWVADYDDQRQWPGYVNPLIPSAWSGREPAIWQWTSLTPQLGSLDLNMLHVSAPAFGQQASQPQPQPLPQPHPVPQDPEAPLGEDQMLTIHTPIERPTDFNGKSVLDLWISVDGAQLGRMKVHSALVIMPVNPADAMDPSHPLVVEVHQNSEAGSDRREVQVQPSATIVPMNVGGRVSIVFDRSRPLTVHGREIHYTA